jgi:histidinol-phosphate phosphatase family protein
MNKAIFLGKDGTLIPDIPYNVNPAKISLYSDAGKSLQRLRQAGFRLIVVSNQAGIAYGYFSETKLPAVWQRITHLLQPFGAEPDAFFYCPHHPASKTRRYAVACNCRKPRPGLLLQAANEMHIDLRQSWMIGDILHDVEAGNRAGCQTILVDRGNETEWAMNAYRMPTLWVNSLQEATDSILQHLNEPCA